MDTKNLEKKMETISPFELKNQLIDMADESLKKTARTMLNAGRGNPNWIATTPREAFFLLGQFGLEECRRVMNLPEGIAGIPQKEGIASRFEAFLKKNNAAHGAKLLEQTYNYLLMQHAAFGGKEVECAAWRAVIAHFLRQVILHQYFGEVQDAVGHRVLVTDDGFCPFMY